MIGLKRSGVWAAAVVAASLFAYCRGHLSTWASDDVPGAVEPSDRFEELRQRTAIRFDHVAYLSPAANATAGQRIWLAPLLLHELQPHDTELTFTEFGAIEKSKEGGYTVDTSRLTIYTTARRIRISGQLYRQDTYVWFYPPAAPGEPLRYRGFRQTLGRDGFPVVRELVTNDATERVFFVSRSLERAAARQFGPPLSGRRYSVEPDIAKQPDVIVARVLADGAQPMGPFVYVDHASLEIPNLKCRCEPSQIGQFTVNRYYHLVSVSDLSSIVAGGDTAESFIWPSNAAHLTGVLRLPDSM